MMLLLEAVSSTVSKDFGEKEWQACWPSQPHKAAANRDLRALRKSYAFCVRVC